MRISDIDFESRPRAVMVAVQLPGVDDGELDSSLSELGRLAKTLGLEVVGRLTQRRSALAAGKVVGDGKLVELAKWTGGTGIVPSYRKPGTRSDDDDDDAADRPEADSESESESENAPTTEAKGPPPGTEPVSVVLVDHDLTPTQQRNLERATGADVLDRTSVILEIFFRHAKTREARLQVEIARLKYLAPRLRESAGGEDRVRGGVGGKGAGESSLELDRRRIRDRIAELRGELGQIESTSHIRRARRGDLPTVALVGYTNAGKSSLMRALTGSQVYVADKLFATLDTATRALEPRTHPPILVSDTVGFIKKLPHDLVASFRSTLEEAADADLVLHLVDAADAALAAHIEVTRTVLGEVGADSPRLLVMNKIDKVDEAGRAKLAAEFPDAIQMSTRIPEDVAMLRERIISHFEGDLVESELVVPWARHGLLHTIHESTRVLAEEHGEEGTTVRVRAPQRTLDRLRDALAAQHA